MWRGNNFRTLFQYRKVSTVWTFAWYGRNSVRKLFARHIQLFCSLRATSGHFEFCAPHKANSSGLAALIGTGPFPRRPHQNSFTFTTSHALLHHMRHNRIQQKLTILDTHRLEFISARAILSCESYRVTVCWSIFLEFRVFITSREYKAVGSCIVLSLPSTLFYTIKEFN